MTQTSKNTGAETMPICNKLKRERLACHNGFTVTIAFITHNGAASPEGDETPLPLSPDTRTSPTSSKNMLTRIHVPSPLFFFL